MYGDLEEKDENKLPYIKTIELDCAPGGMRPEHLIKGVIKGTGLEVKEPSNKLFGNWTWDYSEVDDETWRLINPLLRERISKLHEDGIIRYGSW